MRVKSHIVSVFMVLACCLPMQTYAQDFFTTNFVSESGLLLADIGPSEAATKVVRKTGGKVLKVTQEERNGKQVYRVKVLLPEGRIKTVFVDKATGG